MFPPCLNYGYSQQPNGWAMFGSKLTRNKWRDQDQVLLSPYLVISWRWMFRIVTRQDLPFHRHKLFATPPTSCLRPVHRISQSVGLLSCSSTNPLLKTIHDSVGVDRGIRCNTEEAASMISVCSLCMSLPRTPYSHRPQQVFPSAKVVQNQL